MTFMPIFANDNTSTFDRIAADLRLARAAIRTARMAPDEYRAKLYREAAGAVIRRATAALREHMRRA
jgi:hypothetical protein